MTTPGSAEDDPRERLPWSAFPAEVRAAVEEHFGGPVTHPAYPPGGYSQDMACRLTFGNGRRVFVKGCGPQSAADSLALHRAEARVAASLPARTPAPRLLGAFESGGWMVIAFDVIDGAPPAQPWRPDELENVLSAVTLLAEVLSPSPLEAPTVAERLDEVLRGWRRLHQASSAGSAGSDLSWLDPWAIRHLDELAELEAGWGEAAAGVGLAHADLRADNLLISAGRVMVVDWPWACTAALWFDLLGMLPSVQLAGGPEPESIWSCHPVAAGADDDAVTAVLATKTGFFLRQAEQPAPPGAPTLRAFQRAQGAIALQWLRRRTGWT